MQSKNQNVTLINADMRDVSPDVLNDYFATLGHNATKHIQPRRYPLDYIANRCPQTIFLTPATDAEVISIVYQTRLLVTGMGCL